MARLRRSRNTEAPKGQTGPSSEAVALRRLERELPDGAREVIARLHQRGAQAVLVGGTVRDAFLGRASADWDIATDLVPAKVAELFPRVVRNGEKHGTIMVLTESGPVEVTTFRSEGPYEDGRRPTHVEFHGDLEADLARRDFTINAIAADLPAKKIIDPFGGVLDLRRKVVRCVGMARERFLEDGLRPLRAVRFAAVLGFRLEAHTRAAIPETLSTFDKVAWERKREELVKLLGRATKVSQGIQDLETTALLSAMAPELCGVEPRLLRRLDKLPKESPYLVLAGLAALANVAPASARELALRLRVSNQEAKTIELTLQALERVRGMARFTPADLRRLLAFGGEGPASSAALLASVLFGGKYAMLPKKLVLELAHEPPLRLDQLAVDGHDLAALGLSGPAVGKVLKALFEAVLEQPEINKKSQLLSLAHKLSTGHP